MPSSAPHPPRFGAWLFERLLAVEDSWAVLGDLEEEFRERHQHQGARAARRWYRWHVLRSTPLFLYQTLYWGTLMFKNYLRVALRTLRKHTGYTLLNIFGLAIGLTCCLLFLLFAAHEWQHDRFHTHADRIYRVNTDLEMTGDHEGHNHLAMSSPFVADYLQQDYPEVEQVVRLRKWNPEVRHEGQYYDDDAFLFADAPLFDVFSFDLLAGDAQTALSTPYTMVLTASMAEKYFGTPSALGQSLTLNDSLTFTVTGIVADPPDVSHITFDALIAYTSAEAIRPPHTFDWINFQSNYTYFLLREQAEAANLASKLERLPMEQFGDTFEKVGIRSTLALQALPDIYLDATASAEIGATGDQATLSIFGIIAAFMLILAGINFTNLSTARSVLRAREVGVRKVVGSSRATLAFQFLGESLMLAFLAFIAALLLTYTALPFFATVLGKTITLGAIPLPLLVLISVAFVLTVGILAGLYPALVLSRFEPVQVLKGTFKTSWQGIRLRQGLVIFQFAISVILIVGTLIVWQQLRYMQDQNLGFDQEQVLVLRPPTDDLQQRHEVVAQTFRALPAVQAITTSDAVPGQFVGGGFVYTDPGTKDNLLGIAILSVDYDYAEAMGIPVVTGRTFSEAFTTDAQDAVLINEAALSHLGYASAEEALGQVLVEASDMRPVTIVGVLQDYHHVSLKQEIAPLLFRVLPHRYAYLSLRLETTALRQTMSTVQATWETLFPGYPFDYFFVDDAFNQQYRNDQRVGQIVSVFAGLAILVACLGLFGLAAFSTLQRTKEVGIRKVLGASVPSLITLLARDFMVLVTIAFILATPLAFIVMQRWLDDFAYRITLDWPVFALAGVFAVGIALATVSYQAIRAALTDPVNALRHE